MVFPSDPDSFEFRAERCTTDSGTRDNPSAADEKCEAFVMQTVLASVGDVDSVAFAAMLFPLAETFGHIHPLASVVLEMCNSDDKAHDDLGRHLGLADQKKFFLLQLVQKFGSAHPEPPRQQNPFQNRASAGRGNPLKRRDQARSGETTSKS